MPVLEVNHLSKSFGGLKAVNNLDFYVNEGEILGLVGPNGSGKTTTFNLILGTQKPDSGSIFFKGKNQVGLRPYEICRHGLARTFQLTKPFSGITVFENVKVAAFNITKNTVEASKRALEMLEFLRLSELRNQLAKKLTIPQRKYLELARALATKPEILFLDEPIGGLNEAETDEMMELVRLINNQGITIVAIEHVMRAIMSLSSRIIVLNYGEKIAEGTPIEVSRDERVINSYLGEEYTFA
ncbi:MAG: ABC transporter ATP-binding protein [Thermodesulfobacteriota bacterium]|jgi:branched-chain amino acid transport system ATP-binding protein